MIEPEQDLTLEELEAVVFAVKSDIETLSNMIASSEATEENKKEYTILISALNKLERK